MTLKIEVNKTYLDGAGQKFLIIAQHSWLLVGKEEKTGVVRPFNENGYACNMSGLDHSRLVKEYKEPQYGYIHYGVCTKEDGTHYGLRTYGDVIPTNPYGYDKRIKINLDTGEPVPDTFGVSADRRS